MHDVGMPRHGDRVESDRAVGLQRQRVVDLLRAADTPVDARQIAETLRIHVTTARFHLGALEARASSAGAAWRPVPGALAATADL